MKLVEMFPMQDQNDQFDVISAAEQISKDPGVAKKRKEKVRPEPTQGEKRADARKLAFKLRYRADEQGSADKELNSETPENSPHSSSGMR